MSKSLKKHISDSLKKRLGGLDSFIAVNYQGLDSAQTFDLRRSLHESKTQMSVVPNRLALRVLDEAGGKQAELAKLLKGPTAIVYGEDGALTASRVVMQWKKKNKDLLPVKGGLLQGKVLDAKQAEDLAKIPGKVQLLGQLAGSFQSPLSRLATALQWPISSLARAVDAYRKKLEEGAPAAPASAPAAGAEPAGPPAGA